jgi:hypothetical protein
VCGKGTSASRQLRTTRLVLPQLPHHTIEHALGRRTPRKASTLFRELKNSLFNAWAG